MNQEYYDAVTKMEGMNVDPEYVQGWQGGYLLNPEREEKRVNEGLFRQLRRRQGPQHG